MRTPEGLSGGGLSLWQAVDGDHDLDACQRVTLLEACRAKDRLDRLDAMARGGSEVWAEVGIHSLSVDPGRCANQTADLLKQLLASLRLPDQSGRRPQRRGTTRGVYRPRSNR